MSLSNFFVVLLICLIFCVILIDHSFSIASIEVGEPLIVTSFLKNGKLKEARNKSEVRPLIPGIISHSGFFTVNKSKNANTFFWFFQKTSSDWQQVPVLLWLQGGPGSSSMFALFTEIGPYQIKNDKIYRRKFSWTDKYNLLFLDNPIEAGYSFSDNYFVKTEEEIADHLYEALQQFFRLYPELQKNKFYVTGESYAGKYITAIAYKIHKSNPFTAHKINLKGLIIGNGLCDPESMLNLADHYHRLGLIDFRAKLNLKIHQENARISILNHSWMNALNYIGQELQIVRNITSFRKLYHLLYENIEDHSYVKFIQANETRARIHVGSIPYHDYSYAVGKNLAEDVYKSVRSWIQELIEIYPILIYNGMLDLRIPHSVTADFIDNLHWSGANNYTITKRKKWYVDNYLAGYIKSVDNLKLAFIRNSGHMVPTSQPKIMLKLLEKFVNNYW